MRNNKTKNNGTPQLQKQIADLLSEAKHANKEIAARGRDTRAAFAALDRGADASIRSIERPLSDIDRAEERAGNELDSLILRQAEDLANE